MSEEKQTLQFVNAYTLVLYVMAGFMLLIVIIDPYIYGFLQTALPESKKLFAQMQLVDQTVLGSLSFLCLVTGILRSNRSHFAIRVTAAVSCIFLLVPPVVGLIPFIYWVGWVRNREQLFLERRSWLI
jgi:hypothetical protein